MLTYSKEKRRIDLITISSNDFITSQREPNLKNIFTFESNSTINPNNNTNPNQSKSNNNTISNFSSNHTSDSNLLNNKTNQNQLNTNLNTNTNNLATNLNQIQNTRAFQFKSEKPIIFLSARVHPGETPASFLMNGIINFLLDPNDPRAEILRKAFVFKIIPIINTDGVSRGFYRYDTNSLNMNRHYASPNQKMQPEISAIKRIFLCYAQEGRIRYYYDLHAHASSRGLFLFGNNLDFLPQVENCVLPKLIELNCENLLVENCNFSEKSMKTKEKGDKFSKEGTGRVHFHKVCELIHCYTVEASYYRGLVKGVLPKINFEFVSDFLRNYGDLSHFNNNSNSVSNCVSKANTKVGDFKFDFRNENDELGDKNVDCVIQILAKFYKFNLQEFVKSKVKGIDSLISLDKRKIFNKLDDKDNYFEMSYRSEEDRNSSDIAFYETSRKDNENSINENHFEKHIEINSHYNLKNFDISNINNNTDSNSNNKLNSKPMRTKTESMYKNYSRLSYDNKEKHNTKNPNNFENLFYENRLEKYNFLCASDEDSFHTPISYQKMGVSLLTAILDYEGLNPFSRLYNSEFKDVKGVRENVSKNIYLKEDKYRGNLMISNLNKNIEAFKKFKSLFEKFIAKNEKNKTQRLASKSNIINPIAEKKKSFGTVNVTVNNNDIVKESFMKVFKEKDSINKKNSLSDKLGNMLSSPKKELNVFENFELQLESSIKKITFPNIKKESENLKKGKFLINFY